MDVKKALNLVNVLVKNLQELRIIRHENRMMPVIIILRPRYIKDAPKIMQMLKDFDANLKCATFNGVIQQGC